MTEINPQIEEIDALISLAEEISKNASSIEKRYNAIQIRAISYFILLATLSGLFFLWLDYSATINNRIDFVLNISILVTVGPVIFLAFILLKQFRLIRREQIAEDRNLDGILRILSDIQNSKSYVSISGIQRAIFETRLNRVKFGSLR